MNDTPIDETACASDSGQAPSQPSRLCQACLSVLARDELEVRNLYPHHTDLKSFVQASRMACYICSWLFAALPQNAQERLGQLVEGKLPEHLIAREARMIDGDVSDTRAILRDYIRNDWILGRRSEWYKGVSWVSFTAMEIKRHIWNSNHPTVSVLLHPLYEGYFPLSTTVYDNWLKKLWVTVTVNMCHANLYFVVIPHQDYLELDLVTADLPSNTGSMATWTTIAGWVGQCSERHRCLCHVDSDWYPTRLVEILSNDRFRVVRSDSKCFQSERGYVTLSHRWGDSSDFVKLTTNNLPGFEIGCSITVLRKTFQDAIQCAHRMGIPYIWIDSLCIIQSGDGGADWEEESAKMAQVYSNSFCNISADWGDESNGLFFERTSTFEPPYELHMRWKILESPVVNGPSLPPEGGLCHIVRPDGWSENVMESPLNRRGWVLQERQLASRILHFSPTGVSWECQVKVAWERTPLGFPNEKYARSYGLLGCARTLSSMRRLRLHEADAPVDWTKLVWDYTSCRLTKQSDRLVAIAGIAKVLASKIKDQYVAGIWSKSLPQALVWHTFASRSCIPMTSYFAPSFSWAASEGTVSSFTRCKRILDSTSAVFVQHREKPLSSSFENTVRQETADQLLTDHVFGPITNPEVEVRMRGILRSCRRVPRQVVPFQEYPDIRFYACPSRDIEDSAISSCFNTGTAFDVTYDHAAEEDAQFDSIMYYYTIIVYDIPWNELSASISYRFAEGVLLKSVDSSMGRFQRVGMISHKQRGNGPPANILLPIGNERQLPAWSYEEATGRHTFYIV